MTQLMPPADLAVARAHLQAADAAWVIFHAKLPDDGEGGYWDAGQNALQHIDRALHAIHQCRAELACEMRADEAERERRVEETLARISHRDDEGQPAPGRAHVADNEPPSNEGAHWL